jgi:hypothetical protein
MSNSTSQFQSILLGATAVVVLGGGYCVYSQFQTPKVQFQTQQPVQPTVVVEPSPVVKVEKPTPAKVQTAVVVPIPTVKKAKLSPEISGLAKTYKVPETYAPAEEQTKSDSTESKLSPEILDLAKTYKNPIFDVDPSESSKDKPKVVSPLFQNLEKPFESQMKETLKTVPKLQEPSPLFQNLEKPFAVKNPKQFQSPLMNPKTKSLF